MHITKKQSIALAAGLIALFLILARWQMKGERPDSLPPLNEELSERLAAIEKDPDSVIQSHFSLKDFHRAETKDGKKLWEVKAEEGTYIPEDNKANIHNATILLYSDRKKPVKITAPESIIHLDGTTLTHAEMTGGVTVKAEKGTVLKTKKAVYQRETETITAPGKVQITGKMGKISGHKLSANMKIHEITLEQNVKTAIVPAKQLKDMENE